MASLQAKLISMYVSLGSLPDSCDINTKAGQKLLRDICFYLLVELNEAFEILEQILHASTNNKPQAIPELLEAYNEEWADAWHFILELNDYAGLSGLLLSNYTFLNVSNDTRISDILENTLHLEDVLYNSAARLNQMELVASLSQPSYNLGVDANTLSLLGLSTFKISPEHLEIHQAYNHSIIKEYALCLNELKIKDWSQSTRESNLNNFYNKLFKSFFLVIRYMHYLGKPFAKIFEIYESKNQKNVQRIQAKY